ncbi:uncharacterized protein H6S33_010554 [Morchella sextelata]|uniref:uncharacterized protein n=1 Tax=Morchella sextelata TaxID=1174677 RepID=UPI001D057255|nr:uncharacterized protein H6S33_010554 [Morchella sextelata]KAH0611289.1 hypothetical protein H6S33_010554 [Morchella sextelata]
MQEGVFVNCKIAQQREKASPPHETRIGIIRGCALVTFVAARLAGCFALFTVDWNSGFGTARHWSLSKAIDEVGALTTGQQRMRSINWEGNIPLSRCHSRKSDIPRSVRGIIENVRLARKLRSMGHGGVWMYEVDRRG